MTVLETDTKILLKQFLKTDNKYLIFHDLSSWSVFFWFFMVKQAGAGYELQGDPTELI